MKEDRTAFWFRIRVILSTLLVLLGAGLFFAGYYGYAKKWGIPIEVSFFGSGGMIIAGFAIRTTLFHCPFCGAHIYLRNPVLLYFYSCPSCGHSVGKGKASYLNRRLSTNSVHESKHSNVAHYRRKVITIIALLISWFGDNVFVAPDCGFHTAGHPIDYERRNQGLEYAYPITVGDNVWIGAGVQVMPGVNIGSNVVIGGGSVVVKDIPSNSVAVGNPCKVIRPITEDDKKTYWDR